MSSDNINGWKGGTYSGWLYSALHYMFIGLESPEIQEYTRHSILQFAFISLHISSHLSGLLSDCQMLFQQDGITMIYSMFPPGFAFYQFLTMTNTAVINTVVDSALLTYTRIFLWQIPRSESKDMSILKWNRKCQ